MKILYSTTFLTWTACLLFLSIDVKSQIQSNPAGGDWENPMTWIGNTVPGPTDNVIVDGTVTISNFIACNDLTLTPTGVIQNNPVSYFIINIYGNLINNGTIRNNPMDLVLDVIVNGNVINNGQITNYELVLSGSSDQHIACLNNMVFASHSFTDLKPSGMLIADSDINFSNCIVDLNGNLLIMQDNSKLSISGMSFSNSFIIGNNLKLYMDSDAFITGISMGTNIELLGAVTVGSGVNFSGDIVVNDILQNHYQESSTLTISGNVVNNGSIINNLIGTLLILKVDGNISNNGFWGNSHTKLNGTTDQYVNLINNQPIFQGLQFNAMIGDENFEWFLDGGSLLGQPGYFGASTSTLSFLSPVISSDYGTYNCYSDLTWSRNIIIQPEIVDGILVDLKVNLEGPYNGVTMESTINELLPLNQPYNSAPWNYAGTETVVEIPNSTVVDWILVELRDATNVSSANASTSIATQAGFILENGNIVWLDGVSPLYFNVDVTNNLYAVIRHRNHIGIINNYPLTESEGVYSYDFTTASDKAYGGTSAQKNLGNSAYGMIGGDGNGDGTINETDDLEAWYPFTGKTGYFGGDVNMDIQVNNQDKNDIWYSNFNKSEILPE